MEQLKVNWHFSNECNMRCRYCFCNPQGSNYSLTSSNYKFIISNLYDYGFKAINFVGGEPTLNRALIIKMLNYSKSIGFCVSIVTNGYNLIRKRDYFNAIAPYVSMIGVSIDSLNRSTNMKIGRCVSKDVVDVDDYIELCQRIKSSKIILKINTVVSKLNLYEDFNSFYGCVLPDKVKLFQVLKPNQTYFKRNYDDLLITKQEFDAFVHRHIKYSNIINAENNEQMLNSYYILDSSMKFVNNETGVCSDSLLNCTVENALNQVKIDCCKFQARYAS